MPHLCALHPVSFYPSTSLLRPSGGFPGSLPLGGQRAWQVRRLSSLLHHCVQLLSWIKLSEVAINLLMSPFQRRGQPYIRTEQRAWPAGLGQGCTDPSGHPAHHVLCLRAHNPRLGWVRPHWWNALPVAVSLAASQWFCIMISLLSRPVSYPRVYHCTWAPDPPKTSQLLDCKVQKSSSSLGFELEEVLFSCCELVCGFICCKKICPKVEKEKREACSPKFPLPSG